MARWIVSASAALSVAACGRAPDSAPAIRVFAAASLAAPFEAIAKEFERQHPGRSVELNFGGTPQLVLQLREGVACDVFASADPVQMERVVELQLVRGEVREFARNELTIVVAPGNPKAVQGLADLARADLEVALCGPEVPAGRYARQVLERAAVVVRSVSDEVSVKALVGKVQLGEVDAGIVYATDVRAGRVAAVPIPVAANVVASYPLAVLKAGVDPVGGEQFADFVSSPAGRSILADHGFCLP